MNKKLTNVLRTNVTLYFICLVLFALAAIPFDVRLAIGEGAAAVVLLVIARRRSRSVQQSMRQYMDRFTGGMDSARSSNMLFAPLPMMVFDMDTQAVVWCNDGFLALTEQKEGVFDAHLNAVVPTFSVRWLMEGKNECPEHVVWNHRIYRVYGGLTRPTPDTPATMATTYWMDVTDSEQLRQTLQMTRPVVAILMVDNYEDLMKACPESKRSAVLAQLEEKLDQWSAGADGLMLHYDRDRYLFVFEERSYSDYAQHRFAVLDTVREVAAGGVAATLSIGVGRDADSFDALFKNASLDAADLSRGRYDFANFSYAWLYDTTLTGAVLRSANLYGTDGRRARAGKADFSDASLSGADWSGADLTDAVLQNATLRQTVLRGAVLQNVEWGTAVLDETRF